MLVYSAISCIDLDGAIGYKNNLLFKSKIDLQHFKKVTEDKLVILGRKTADSIVEMNGTLLPNITKLILTRDKDYYPNFKKDDSIFIYNSLEHLFFALNIISNFNHNRGTTEEVIVAGGSEIYKIFEPHLSKIYLTEVSYSYEKKDSYFPVEMSNFYLDYSEKYIKSDGQGFSINTYIRKDK